MKIRVIKSEKPTFWYAKRIGEVFDGELDVFFKDSKYRVEDCRDGTDDAGFIDFGDCEVVTDHSASIDGLTQNVATLTLRVTELERQVAELRRPKTPETVAAQIAEGFAKLAGGKRKEPELERDSVIEMAKKDVAELEREVNDCRREVAGSKRYVNVKFHINHDKRTVVAVLIGQYSKRAWARGKSRCAPDDCFNTAIGRAIALRRALGLDIPEYYVKAPQPTEVRVGDIVEIIDTIGGTERYTVAEIRGEGTDVKICAEDGGYAYANAAERYGAPATSPKVIDDSRDQDGGER